MATTNPAIGLFQTALGIRKTNSWNDQTKNAMQSFQDESGLDLTEFPDAHTLAALDLHPSFWKLISIHSGAPEEWSNSVAKEANKVLTEALSSEMQDILPSPGPSPFEKQQVGRGSPYDVSSSAQRVSVVAPDGTMTTVSRTGDRIPSTTTPVPGVTPGVTSREEIMALRDQGAITPDQAAAALMTVPKKGIPGWGWALIIGGGVVAVAAVGGGVWYMLKKKESAAPMRTM